MQEGKILRNKKTVSIPVVGSSFERQTETEREGQKEREKHLSFWSK